MGVIIARNMLSLLELLKNRYGCIYLVVYIIVLVMHGHINVKPMNLVIQVEQKGI
jgi:hypothetical protein